MKKLLGLSLLLASLVIADAGVPYVVNLGGRGTNVTLYGDTLNGFKLIWTNLSFFDGATTTKPMLTFSTNGDQDMTIGFQNGAGKQGFIYWYPLHAGASDPELSFVSDGSLAICPGTGWVPGSAPPANRKIQLGVGGNHLPWLEPQDSIRGIQEYQGVTNTTTTMPYAFPCKYYSNNAYYRAGVPQNLTGADAALGAQIYPIMRFEALDTNGNGAFAFYDFFDLDVTNTPSFRLWNGDVAAGKRLKRMQLRTGWGAGGALPAGLDVFGGQSYFWVTNSSHGLFVIDANSGVNVLQATTSSGAFVQIGNTSQDCRFYLKTAARNMVGFDAAVGNFFINTNLSVGPGGIPAANAPTNALEVHGTFGVDGVGRMPTNAAPLVVITNTPPVPGTRYTVGAGRAFVTASFQCTAAAGQGATASLTVENNFTNTVQIGNSGVASEVMKAQLSLMCSPGSVYYFTTNVTGAGADAAYVAGTFSITYW